jgi:signal transduction histidine kinase
MSLKQKIDLAFGIGFSALLFITLATYQSTKLVSQNFEWLSNTQQTLYYLNQALMLTIDVETGQRGYIITGNTEFLEPMDRAKLRLPGVLDTLRRDFGRQNKHEQFIELERLINRKISLSDQGVGLRKTGDTTEALAFIGTGEGKMIMDSIRSLEASFEQAQMHSLKKRSDESLDNTLYSQQNFILLSALIVAFVVIVYYIIRRNAKVLLKYQEEQRLLIDVLTKQNRQLDDFAYITSHNIRSSSGNISGLINLLKEDSPKEEYREILARLRQVADNLTLTLNELVNTLQVRKDVNIERQHIAFEEVLNRVKQSLGAELIRTHGVIEVDLSKAPTIDYPLVYLESIVHNLISNSLKYAHPTRPPRINVISGKSKDRVFLKISDNGLGIDLKKYGEKLFGFRKTFHEHPDAKGLGLFMTKAQIETLGGSVSVESEVDKGTTFTILF